MFLSAQIGAELAQRLKLPAVVGEISAGCILGSSVLGWVRITEPFELLAGLGAIFLLFSVGLETRLEEFKKVGRISIIVAVAGVVLPFLLGAGWAKYSGYDSPKAMFVGAAFVATSAGITARVLQDMGVLSRIESRVILGAAVIDDILAMLLLGVVTSLQGGERIIISSLLMVLLQAVGFVALIALVGTTVMRQSSPLLDAPVNPHSPLTITLAVCLGLACAASYLGLAAIIGAFLAGMVAAESRQRQTLEKQMQAITALFVPFFFVVTGAKLDLSNLGSASALTALLVITLLAVGGKVLGCGGGAASLGWKPALIVGVGMVPRGEVGIIVASLGFQAGVFSSSMYTLIIAMSLLTSIIAPPALSILLADKNSVIPQSRTFEQERRTK
jgi:Kef-type K+ transport system membrane component KefB